MLQHNGVEPSLVSWSQGATLNLISSSTLYCFVVNAYIYTWTNFLVLLQTKNFAAVLLVHFASSILGRKPLPFNLHPNLDLVDTNFDPISGLSITNSIRKENQTMKADGTSPWRGAREKTPVFMQLLIEACSRARDRVVDMSVSTGNCCPSLRYIIK